MKESCWKEIGVQGDHSCPELEKVVHCHNCGVYRTLGQALFDRPAPTGYIQEWTDLLAKPRVKQQREAQAFLVAIFRLGDEWLGLPAKLFQLVLEPNPVHHLPHRSDRLLRGLVNVQGKLLLCASLQELLSIKADDAVQDSNQLGDHKVKEQNRLVVIAQQEESWAFEVNDFYGVQRFYDEDQSNLPSLSGKTLATFTQNILRWKEENVSYLNAGHLFESLRRHIL